MLKRGRLECLEKSKILGIAVVIYNGTVRSEGEDFGKKPAIFGKMPQKTKVKMMGKSTLLKKNEKMSRKQLAQCHGGEGVLDCTLVLGDRETKGKRLNFIHDDLLPAGASVGIHQHMNDEEYYYIVSGRGIMVLDGEKFEVKAGDIAAVFPGGSHGLENNGTDDLRVIVVSIS